MPWTPGRDWGTFIGKGYPEDGDEGTILILGGGSERVSFGECCAGYQYIYVRITQAPWHLGPTTCVRASL